MSSRESDTEHPLDVFDDLLNEYAGAHPSDVDASPEALGRWRNRMEAALGWFDFARLFGAGGHQGDPMTSSDRSNIGNYLQTSTSPVRCPVCAAIVTGPHQHDGPVTLLTMCHGVGVGVDGASVVIGVNGQTEHVVFDEAMELRDELERAIGEATENAVDGGE